MPTSLADAIRAHLDSKPLPQAYIDATSALQAVGGKCEAMRAESAGVTGGVGHFFADEFENVIARALGVKED